MRFSVTNVFGIMLLLLSSCNASSNAEELDNWDEFKVPYFDFDQVEHYRSNVSEEELYPMTDESASDTKDEAYMDVIGGGTPKDMSDTLFIQELIGFGYEYQELPASNHPEISDIFREKSDDPNNFMMMCMPVYNDILIFRKEQKISGIAKICFGCRITHFIGTSAKTRNFGALKGFERLRKVLRE